MTTTCQEHNKLDFCLWRVECRMNAKMKADLCNPLLCTLGMCNAMHTWDAKMNAIPICGMLHGSGCVPTLWELREPAGSPKPMATVSSVVFKKYKMRSMPRLCATMNVCAHWGRSMRTCYLIPLFRPESPLMQLVSILQRLVTRMYFHFLTQDSNQMILFVSDYGRVLSGWLWQAGRAAKSPGWRSTSNVTYVTSKSS